VPVKAGRFQSIRIPYQVLIAHEMWVDNRNKTGLLLNRFTRYQRLRETNALASHLYFN
jgi:hypothetical protein